MKERLSWFQRFFGGRQARSLSPRKKNNNKAEEQIGRVCLSFVSYISGVGYIEVFQNEKNQDLVCESKHVGLSFSELLTGDVGFIALLAQ